MHPDKMQLIALGRFIAREREARGEEQAETFGFVRRTEICRVR
jgi:hypothetical protein